MKRYLRIGAIYRNELLNILRDRRTMLAMIIIPVVLYPVLMLGFVRAVESDELSLRSQQFLVETDSAEAEQALSRIIEHGQDPGRKDQATFEVRVGRTPADQLGDEVQLHVALQQSERPEPLPPHLAVKITYSEINARSRSAMEQLSLVFERYRQWQTRESLGKMLGDRPRQDLAGRSWVDLVLDPVDVQTVSAATEQQRGGWALGQIVPVILVLMTITGAIYPAIDVTAGERERGTLEALLATPVPILHLIIAKFLVVATIGLLAALINVSSVGATMHFGGLTRAIAAGNMPVRFPASALPIIVLCMVPFAMLSAAILVAVCSFARSFKEAQTYVTPVIILALVPAVVATLPSVQLKGILLVLPVGNMVLLARELFQQTCTWTQVVVVLFSTTLYAAAAIGVAARLFGQEAVLFADAGSYKTMFQRRLFKPAATPTASQAILLVALLFPLTFYLNSLLSEMLIQRFMRGLAWLGVIQFAGLFVLLPIGIALYLKIDLVKTFRWSRPAGRAWIAALLIGASSWVVTSEFFALQARLVAPSQLLQDFNRQVESQLSSVPLWAILALLAVVPAVAEEFLFRGFLLSGLGRSSRKWTAILAAALIFGIFHFIPDRMPVTAMMGVVLGYLCWQSGSLWPGILAHAMHNSCQIILPQLGRVAQWLGLAAGPGNETQHLPLRVLVAGAILFLGGLAILASIRQRREIAAL
jgi:sodium transport system permease protein